VSGIRRVVVVLVGMGLGVGCGSSDPSGPNASAPTVANLSLATGPNRTLIFQMIATDPEGDIVGGRCIFRSTTFIGNPIMTVTPAVPPNPTAPLAVTCTLTIASAFTGQPMSGTIGIADVRGNASNVLTFATTLPERARGGG
jgi:hypothetical protein